LPLWILIRWKLDSILFKRLGGDNNPLPLYKLKFLRWYLHSSLRRTWIKATLS